MSVQIREALQQDPDEYLADHRSELEALRDDVDDELLVETIDAVLADLNDQEGSG